MKRLMCLFVLVSLLVGSNGMAEGDANSFYTCSSERKLNLTAAPSFIEKAGIIRHCHFPYVIYYHDINMGAQREYWGEVFNTNGDLIFSKRFMTIRPETDPVPYAQVYYDHDLLHCEYYPDITTMENCYYSSFHTDGTVDTANKKMAVKPGKAFYKENIGDYLLSKQAHLYENDPEQRIEIRNCFSGKSFSLKTTEFFSAFGRENEGILFFAQMRDGNIEVYQYSADKDQPTIINIKCDSLQNNEFGYVSSMAANNQTAYILIRFSNTQYDLLNYNLETKNIVANREFSTAVGNDYTRNVLTVKPSLLAFVDTRWDDQLQDYRLLPYAYSNDQFNHSLLPTARTILSVDLLGTGSQLFTLEELSPQAILLCTYDIKEDGGL